ncbi:daunorubicin resistance protein DrrA family ABC transporter ATP-binding protein [Kineosporia mesophila]|uniref:Daunorubicin resistance protein DrrA family ABC transporter ATP-binding protein n=1 Tax=Kineosporia mesophila TaxID=566012 RepID=A0ABP6ZCK2_9ACTN|nr:ATP-binding cassette domain-containing protein [Kineosporia mesophila]MCD5350156.1 ATP-binding cassette domain-containing protein [Kineosporia mesophila]
MTDLAIETAGLVKMFGPMRAVDGVDLKIPVGGVYAVLGPNGAGKTTTIRMLATLLVPDGGTATVLGHDVVREAAQVRARVAMTGQFASLDEDLTGLENLLLLSRLYGYPRRAAQERAHQLLTALDLDDAANKQVKAYSGGMRRRIDIAGSIVVRPDLMFLDEPTTGLDPRSRNQVWEIVRALVGAGTTILLTTQYLEEADQLADRIAVIDHGRVIAEGTSGQLKASVGTGAVKVRVADPADRDEVARLLGESLATEPVLESDPASVSLRVTNPAAVAGALHRVGEHGLVISEYSLGQPSLDEVFLALTGKATEPEVPV